MRMVISFGNAPFSPWLKTFQAGLLVLCVFVSRSRFWRYSFVVRVLVLAAVSSKNTGGKEDGIQTQKRKGFMAGEVRQRRVAGKSDCHRWQEGVVLPLLFRNQRLDKSQVSKMQNGHSVGVARQAYASRVHEDGGAVGQFRRRRVMEKTRCCRIWPSGQKQQNCAFVCLLLLVR